MPLWLKLVIVVAIMCITVLALINIYIITKLANGEYQNTQYQHSKTLPDGDSPVSVQAWPR